MSKPSRGARFQVSWVDDLHAQSAGPPSHRDCPDYIVLELLPDDVRRLHKQLELGIALDDANLLDDTYLTVLLQGKAYAQAADAEDGTTTYPPSLLSEEVLAETPRRARWRPPRALSVSFTKKDMTVVLEDGKKVTVLLSMFPKLANAPPHLRDEWKLVGKGIGLHWPDLDEDISVEALLNAQEFK